LFLKKTKGAQGTNQFARCDIHPGHGTDLAAAARRIAANSPKRAFGIALFVALMAAELTRMSRECLF
jgi:hypothetical protein